MNPDDSDLHHGPQLHTHAATAVYGRIPGHESQGEHHYQEIHGLDHHHDTALYHGHKVHRDVDLYYEGAPHVYQ